MLLRTLDIPLRARGALLAFAALTAGTACKRPGVENQTSAARAQSEACVATYQGWETPALAYKQYAEASKQGQWCRVINTFDRAARPDLALGAFKALAVMAFAMSPQREAYLKEFNGLVLKHELEYQEQAKFVELGTDLMNRRLDSPALGAASAAIAKQPELFYLDTIAAMMRANPTARTTPGDDLTAVVIDGDAATAKAQQSDGREAVFKFVKTSQGWMLKFQ